MVTINTTTRKEEITMSFRLPTCVIPKHYDLHLSPNLTEFTFTGSVDIDVTVKKPVSFITLNAKELTISEASVSNESGTTFVGSVSLNKETEMAVISFNGVLGEGSWKLRLNFAGTLNDSLKGFYRSFWTDKNGIKHAVATTQFESTDARRCFPCFDEPEFKATFKATLEIDNNLQAISNGRLIKEEPIAGTSKKMVEFATTMKMSTYLVAFVIGEFESSKPVFANGKELRIWANPGKVNLMNFALKSAAHAISWFENYYGVPYAGGDKIDFIAINDFASGAMENLGCITFRETALLVDEATATQAELKRVAEVVMHELAHMWFGDLVTMKWWNGLWLNESFATFMENKCLHAWRPKWHIWNDFAVSRAAASRVDALKSTHPIECHVERPEDAAELFDVISYEKGCSVLRQIEQFIGEDVFQAGISAYLKKHAFGNTETFDLWDALEDAAKDANLNIPVRTIMDTWVFTAGHPVVTVAKSKSMEGFIELSQTSFKFLNTKDDNATLWPIPITMQVVSSNKATTTKMVLSSRSQTVYVGEDFDYVVINAGGSGFYRVAYESELLEKLSVMVQEKLSVVERFNLVNDTWSCVKAQVTSATDYLQMLSLFENETDPSVWSIITGSLRSIQSLVAKESRDSFAAMVSKLLTPTFKSLGLTPKADETVQTKQLRGTIIGALGTLGEDKVVQSKAVELFEAWKSDKTSIDANLLPSVVSILSYTGDCKRYDEFVNLFKTSTTPQDVNRFMYALTEFRDPKLVNRTLASSINGDIRSQDAPYVVQRLMGNEDAALSSWNFIQNNWDAMVSMYPNNGVVRMIGGIAALDTSESLLAEVKEFFANHPVEAGTMALAQAMEQQHINVRLRSTHTEGLKSHFTKLGQKVTPKSK